MELNEDEFIQVVALRRETWETNPTQEINGLFSSTSCPFDGLDSTILPNSFTCMEPTASTFYDLRIHCWSPILPTDLAFYADLTCKAEPAVSDDVPITASNASHQGSNSNKKIGGQPSKNLMAERRRRKRLNDRLSMLRSIVPKISKMDRTSILWDTIEYMKELRDKINKLEEEIDVGSNQLNVNPNHVRVRNSPKLDVERREMDTRIEMCCGAKPGLLLSTLTTVEALGLDIQHCVITCFNDFSLRASCPREIERRNVINSEEIKQALFRNAGYGGRCL